MIHLSPHPSGDDTLQVQAAIDSLPPTGGRIQLSAGKFNVQKIRIGNGSASVESSRHGVVIAGEGPGCIPDFCAPTQINYTGPDGGIFVEFNGPVLGCGLERLMLNGQNRASTLVWMGHTTRTVLRDVYATGYVATGLICTTVKVGHHYGSGSNMFDNVSIVGPANENSCGVLFDGMVPLLDTCSCVWIGGIIDYGGAPGSFGIKLSGADNNAFLRTHFCCYGFDAVMRKHGKMGPAVLFQRWRQNPSFPNENSFFACSLATNPAGEGGFGNMFFPLCEGDMADRNHKIPDQASGMRTMGGLFGDMASQDYVAYKAGDPGICITNVNGGNNLAGALSLCRRGYMADGSPFDVPVATMHADYFDGIKLRHHEQDLLWAGQDGLRVWVGGRWRKVALEG